jgi:hypothetical protein
MIKRFEADLTQVEVAAKLKVSDIRKGKGS